MKFVVTFSNESSDCINKCSRCFYRGIPKEKRFSIFDKKTYKKAILTVRKLGEISPKDSSIEFSGIINHSEEYISRLSTLVETARSFFEDVGLTQITRR